MNIELTEENLRAILFAHTLIFQRLRKLEETTSDCHDYELGRYTIGLKGIREAIRKFAPEYIADCESIEKEQDAMGLSARKRTKYVEPPPPIEEERERVRQTRLRLLAENSNAKGLA